MPRSLGARILSRHPALAVRPDLVVGALPLRRADTRGLPLGTRPADLDRAPRRGRQLATGLGRGRARPDPGADVAWLTWHIDWWWSTALAHVEGRTPTPREEVFWAGDAALTRLDDLRAGWATALEAADPDAPAAYPWPADAGLTVTHLAAWVNAELMKNAAEIGQLRLLRAASLACGV
ncbi:DinB family protein [Nocardia amikacinitolerans]|uniref:DinB family protein n=1 Tax=Nocardia amikacinitolerans TaxID=756689 RepID=UPI0014710126|nr:DinB family protein [Nocardia amikacinitolerans]